MLKDTVVKEKNMHEQMKNFNRKMATIKMSQMKIIYPIPKNMISKMKNYYDILDTSQGKKNV